MPNSVTGFDEMPLYDVPAGPASIRQAASRRRLQRRFLRAGRDAVDDRELLELLLFGRRSVDDAGALSGALLDMFGTAPRVLAARPDRLRSVAGLSDDAIAALKAAEALGIRMARADVPDTVRPSLGSYDKVIEYCRALAGHREIEEFHLLFLNRKNLLIADECLQRGSVCHTPDYPREICIRCVAFDGPASGPGGSPGEDLVRLPGGGHAQRPVDCAHDLHLRARRLMGGACASPECGPRCPVDDHGGGARVVHRLFRKPLDPCAALLGDARAGSGAKRERVAASSTGSLRWAFGVALQRLVGVAAQVLECVVVERGTRAGPCPQRAGHLRVVDQPCPPGHDAVRRGSSQVGVGRHFVTIGPGALGAPLRSIDNAAVYRLVSVRARVTPIRFGLRMTGATIWGAVKS